MRLATILFLPVFALLPLSMRAADLPHGLGIGSTGTLKQAEQIHADLVILHDSLDEISLDDHSKKKVEALIAAAESSADELRINKADNPSNADKDDGHAQELRAKFDKEIAGLLTDKQIDDWADHAKIDFIQDMFFPNGSVLTVSAANGGPGLDLTEKQLSEIKPEIETAAAAMDELIQASDKDRERKRDSAIKSGRAAHKKVRHVLTAGQIKKFDQFMRDKIKELQSK